MFYFEIRFRSRVSSFRASCNDLPYSLSTVVLVSLCLESFGFGFVIFKWLVSNSSSLWLTQFSLYKIRFCRGHTYVPLIESEVMNTFSRKALQFTVSPWYTGGFLDTIKIHRERLLKVGFHLPRLISPKVDRAVYKETTETRWRTSSNRITTSLI